MLLIIYVDNNEEDFLARLLYRIAFEARVKIESLVKFTYEI